MLLRERGVVVFVVDAMEGWMLVMYGSLHARHISFDLTYDTAEHLFWRVLHFFLFLSLFENNPPIHIVEWQA